MMNFNATKKGLLISLLLILSSLVLFYGLHFPVNGKSQYIILCTYIAGILWVLIDFKNKSEGEFPFKDYFSEGFKAFIVITLLMVLYTFVFYRFNPQILENGIIENNILVAKEGNHTAAEIEVNANKLRNIFMPMMLFLTTVKFIFLGALVTAVTAGFFSQKYKQTN